MYIWYSWLYGSIGSGFTLSQAVLSCLTNGSYIPSELVPQTHYAPTVSLSSAMSSSTSAMILPADPFKSVASELNPLPFLSGHTFGVPGVPMIFVMSTSGDFLLFKSLSLFTFFDFNHVRLFMTFLQPYLDLVEGTGWLALSQSSSRVFASHVSSGVTSPLLMTSSSDKDVTVCPLPPSLMQSGLGDVEVSVWFVIHY